MKKGGRPKSAPVVKNDKKNNNTKNNKKKVELEK